MRDVDTGVGHSQQFEKGRLTNKGLPPPKEIEEVNGKTDRKGRDCPLQRNSTRKNRIMQKNL